jgi:hypothetical protein
MPRRAIAILITVNILTVIKLRVGHPKEKEYEFSIWPAHNYMDTINEGRL